jgi:hypothetical protein
VETFIKLLEREGPRFAQDADFETELEFERRVRTMAEPRSPEPTSQPRYATDTAADAGNWRTTVFALRQRALKG